MSFEALNRDKWIAEVDLALAALRRVIVRVIDAAPAKLAPAAEPAKVTAPPRGMAIKPATREMPASLQRISAAGLEINVSATGGTVTFRGASAQVSRRQAQLAAVLAKASPNFITRVIATERAWPDLTAGSRETTVATMMAILAQVLAPIKIKVEAVRGYGLRLWAMEEDK